MKLWDPYIKGRQEVGVIPALEMGRPLGCTLTCSQGIPVIQLLASEKLKRVSKKVYGASVHAHAYTSAMCKHKLY